MEDLDRDKIEIVEKKLRDLKKTLKEIKEGIDENNRQYKMLKEGIERINYY